MDKIAGISKGSPAPKPRKVETPADNLFKQRLEAAQVNKTATSEPTQAVGSLGEITPTALPKVQTISHVSVVQKTDRLLDLLDNYAKDIDNPDKTLKDIEPLIDTIKEDAFQLLKEADIALSGDENLKRIAQETAVTANVEHFKFHRGDYI